MERAVQRSLCFTKFLIQRDQLSAAMTRLGSGFHTPNVLAETKRHLQDLEASVKKMEEIYKRPEKSCCGRGD